MKKKEISIKIDTLMSLYPKSIQIFTDKYNTKQLVVFDENSNSISFYNLKKSFLAKKIIIERDGPTGIGTFAINGVHVHNDDSIFVATGQRIFIINSTGKTIYNITFARNNVDISGMPFISPDKPAYFDGVNLYVSIYPDRDSFELNNFKDEQMKSMAIVNLKKRIINTVVPFPQPYKDGIYGPNYLFPFQTFNKLTDEFIFSFSACSNLYIYDKKDVKLKDYKEAISKGFCMVEPMKKVKQDYDSYNSFFIKSPSYAGIYFDEKNKLYYRLAFKARTEDEYNDGKFWKLCSIIILDSQFKKVGEVFLDEKSVNNLLVVNEGEIYCVTESNIESQIKIAVLIPQKL